MQQIVAGTGWRVAKRIRSGGALYVAILEKTTRTIILPR
jgi:hypothetical protein